MIAQTQRWPLNRGKGLKEPNGASKPGHSAPADRIHGQVDEKGLLLQQALALNIARNMAGPAGPWTDPLAVGGPEERSRGGHRLHTGPLYFTLG